jgi:hypothetical protein
MSRAVLAYVLGGSLLTGLYAFAELRGWETGTAAHARIDPSVRQSPGGWRTWTFWHRGLHGGK